MRKKQQNRLLRGRLLGKITACLAVFAIILIWGWRTEYEFRRSHHPPAFEMLNEEEEANDVTILRRIEINDAHLFLPRQYVKILRREQAVRSEGK